MAKKQSYRRYTDLPSLVAMLSQGQITLLDPASWDDKNDSFFLSTYKEKKSLNSVLALCFTTASETYHHWRVFSSGPAGICIHFKPSALENAFRKQKVQFKKVNYLKVDQLQKNPPTIPKLPFIKRFPFRAEREFRALWESKSEIRDYLAVEIDLGSITRITLSPWLHPNLRENMVALLKSIDGCKSIPVYRSTLTGDPTWQSYGRKAT